MNFDFSIFLVIMFVYSVVCGSYCATLAEEKKRSAMLWFLGGFFFGIIALIAVAGIPISFKAEQESS